MLNHLDIIRVGGRSKSEVLQKCNLKARRCTRDRGLSFAFRDLDEEKTEFSVRLYCFTTLVCCIATLVCLRDVKKCETIFK